MLARVQDALALVGRWLPLAVLGATAAGSWWLWRMVDQPDSRPVRTLPPDAFDYAMKGFLLQRFDPQGRLQAQFEGERMQHFPSLDLIEVQALRAHATGPDGRITRAQAQGATLAGDGSWVLLHTGARVVREPPPGQGGAPLIFEGEELQVHLHSEQLQSDRPMTLQQGQSTIKAQRVLWDHAEQKMRWSGGVEAVFMPAPTRR